MKTFILLAFLFPFLSHAKIDIKPGLWKYTNEIKMNGQKFDLGKQMQAMMANLDEETKKKIKAQGLGNIGDMNPEVCITKEMIKKGDLLPDSNSKCTFNFSKKTAKRLVASYNCKETASGNFDIKITSDSQYQGVINSKDKKGNKVDINFVARRLSGKCKK